MRAPLTDLGGTCYPACQAADLAERPQFSPAADAPTGFDLGTASAAAHATHCPPSRHRTRFPDFPACGVPRAFLQPSTVTCTPEVLKMPFTTKTWDEMYELGRNVIAGRIPG